MPENPYEAPKEGGSPPATDPGGRFRTLLPWLALSVIFLIVFAAGDFLKAVILSIWWSLFGGWPT
jgi:hypothetical protein